MIRTHKIEMKPTSHQVETLEKYFGYARLNYNRALAMWDEMYKLGEKPTARKVRDKIKSQKLYKEKDKCFSFKVET